MNCLQHLRFRIPSLGVHYEGGLRGRGLAMFRRSYRRVKTNRTTGPEKKETPKVSCGVGRTAAASQTSPPPSSAFGEQDGGQRHLPQLANRLLLQILASVAEFERKLIKERTLVGVRAAKANGKHVGRPRRVLRRDDVVRLRDEERLSWRAVALRLRVPVMTAVDAYRARTETVPAGGQPEPKKPRPKKRAQ